MGLIAQAKFSATITVAGRPVPGTFDGVSGGDSTADVRSHRAGGGAKPEAYGLPGRTEDVVVRRAYRGERDALLRRWLVSMQGEEVGITTVSLGRDNRPLPGTQETAVGILGTVTKPELDSESEDIQSYSVTIGISGSWS